jgi:hypothetical protein
MRATFVPYLESPQDLISHSGWRIIDGAGEQALPAAVPHWDYQTTLCCAAAVSVQRDAILHRCELAADTGLVVAVTARSDHTNAHGLVRWLEVPLQPRYDLAVELELPGHTLGGRLDLVTQVVVAHPRPLSTLAARRPGSILWRTEHRTLLEGSAPRFPTDAADFRQTRPQSVDAGWYLHLDSTDPDASFMSAVRLTVNTASERMRRVLAGDADPEVLLLLRTLRWDVTRQLILRAVEWDDVEDGPPDHESTTVVGVLRSLLAQVWPLDEPSVLRKRFTESPELVELQIQHHARLLTP